MPASNKKNAQKKEESPPPSLRFLSHNTQGHRGDVQGSALTRIGRNQLDVVALQESGSSVGGLAPVGQTPNLFSGEVSLSNSTRKTRLSSASKIHALHYEFKGSKQKNNRASLSMFSREKPKAEGIIPSRHRGTRPMLFMQFDNMVVTNVHLPSGRPAFAAKVMHGFLEDLNAKLGNKLPTLVLGDLNMDKRRAQKTAQPHDFKSVSVSHATQISGGTLDHTLTRKGTISGLNSQFSSSDHGNLSGSFTPIAKK